VNSSELKEIILDEIRKFEEVNALHSKSGKFSSKEDAAVYSLTANALDNKTRSPDQEIPARGRATKKGKISSKFGMNTGKPDKQCGRLTIKGKPKKKTRSCKDYPSKYKEGLLATPETTPTDIPPKKKTVKTDRKSKRPRRVIKVTFLRNEGRQKRPISKKRKLDATFPGYGELKSLARGITEDPDLDISLEDWIDGLKKLLDRADDYERKQVETQLAKLGFYSSSKAIRLCKQRGLKSLGDWIKTQNALQRSQTGKLNEPEKT